MAVEIPVVIDIERAFEEAAKRVGTAMQPLKKKIEGDVLNVKYHITVPTDQLSQFNGAFKKIAEDIDAGTTTIERSFEQLFAKGAPNLKELGVAVGSFKQQLNDLWNKGVTDESIIAPLQQAIVLAQEYVQHRNRAVNLSAEIYAKELQSAMAIERGNYALAQSAKTIAQISDKLSALRGKMQNITPGGADWGATAREIMKATDALAKFELQLAKSTTKPGSINRIAAEMRALEEKWNAMSRAQKFDKDGNLKKSAERMIEKYRQLTEQSDKYGRSLADLSKKQARVFSQTNLDLKAQVPLLSQLTRMAGTYLSVFSAYRLIHNIREITAEFEKQKVALAALVQSQAVANELFEQLKSLALQSPFQFMELTTYTKQLSAYQIESDKLFDTTKRLADISAGLGVDMSRLILAYGQVRAASVLRGQELRQFTEAGIPLVEALADKFTKLKGEVVSTADVFQLISERAVPFEMIDEIFRDMTDESGRFYNMQQKQAQTLAGQWSNLKDAIQITMAEIGQTKEMQEIFKDVIWAVGALGRHWRDLISAVKAGTVAWAALRLMKMNNTIATKALTAAEAQEMVIEKGSIVYKRNLLGQYKLLRGEKVRNIRKTERLWRAEMRLAASTNAVSFAFNKLRLAWVTNPIGIIGTVVGAAATAFALFSRRTEEAAEAVEEVAKTTQDYINETESAVETVGNYYVRTEKAIRRYEELANASNRNNQEQEEFLRLQRELIKEFPGAASGINEVTYAVEGEAEAIRKLRDEELQRKKDVVSESMGLLYERQIALSGTVNDLRKYKEIFDLYNDDFLRFSKELREAAAKGDKERVDELTEYTIQSFYSAQRRLYGRIELPQWYAEDFVKRLMSSETPRENIITDFIKYNKEFEDAYAAIRKANDELGNLDELLNGFTGWRKFVGEQKKLTSAGTMAAVYTEQEIQNFKSLDEALDDVAKKYKEAKASRDQLEKSFASMVISEDERSKIGEELKVAEAFANVLYAILEHYDALGLLKTKSTGGSHQTDPFITQMKDRIKFMKDFQKGYDDLQKHISSRSARNREASIMLGRGLSLGLSPEEQLMAADNLRMWYGEQIDAVMAEMKKKGAKGTTVADLLGQQFSDKTNWGKTMKEWQGLLQDLWDAATDLDNTKLVDTLEKKLKVLQVSLKRSETARNFYRDILDLTGDEELAAKIGLSVYGDVGAEFKQRIQTQLEEALKSLDPKDIDDALRKAFADQDFATILKNLDKFPEEWQKVLTKMAEDSDKYNADRAKDLIKALKDAKTYGEKRVELARQTAKRMADIDAMSVSEDIKNQLRKQNLKKDAEETAKLQYEVFKDTPLYVEMFASLDTATTEMLGRMKESLIAMKSQWKDLSPKDLKELQSRIAEIDEQLASRNPFKARANAMSEYNALLSKMSREDAEQKAADAAKKRARAERDLERAIEDVNNQQLIYNAIVDAQGSDSDAAAAQLALLNRAKKRMKAPAKLADDAKEEADAAEDLAISYDKAYQSVMKNTEAISSWAESMNSVVSSAKELVAVFAGSHLTEDITAIADGIQKTVSGAAKVALGATEMEVNPFKGTVDLISGIADFATGIFGTGSQLRVNDFNRQIERQTVLLNELDYTYGRLEDAISRSFGSDYIYNYTQQLEILEQRRQAYLKQAALERGKGNKKDKNQIREYLNSAREVQDEIDKMRSGLADFFAGTDVTSAARDFADAWIQAYREFGSTTSAMTDQFNAMVENMVKNSLAAQLMQNLLQPVFDEIQAASESGGQLTASEIAHIAEMAKEVVPQINAGMETLMAELASAGINMRQSASGLTGISRNIANASEESILGLAAGINTQNYYMSFVPTISENVSAILAALGGEPSSVKKSSASSPVPYEDQMLEYAASIPLIRSDTAEIRSLLEKVVKPVGVKSSYYVATSA